MKQKWRTFGLHFRALSHQFLARPVLAVIMIHGMACRQGEAKRSERKVGKGKPACREHDGPMERLHRLARAASALLGRCVSSVRGWRGLRFLLGTTSAFLCGGSGGFGFVGVGVDISGWQRLARTAPSLLRRRDSSFSFNLSIVLFFLDLLLIISRKRLARTASSLLRGDFSFLVVFGGGRERLARTVPSLLRSNFGLFFLLGVVVNRSGLLRAASAFLCGSCLFIIGVGSLLATSLLRDGLGMLFIVVVIFVGSLILGGTAAFLASRLLRVAVLSALGIVRNVRRSGNNSTLLVQHTFSAALSVAERNMLCLDLPV